MSFDAETWHRTVFEALRPIDPKGLFNVSLAEMDFRDVGEHVPEDFPAAELAAFVDDWLDGLDPDASVDPNAPPSQTEWRGGGVRLVIRARGRGPSWRGWTDVPSFNMLEPKFGDLHLVSGEERRLIDLTLEEIDGLARGELRLVGQGASYQETFKSIGDEMRHFGLRSVAELPPAAIEVYASMLGLMSAPPDLGNYDAGWRDINRRPPEG